MISAGKSNDFDATTIFAYSHANTPLGQSERAHYLSYFIIVIVADADKVLPSAFLVSLI